MSFQLPLLLSYLLGKHLLGKQPSFTLTSQTCLSQLRTNQLGELRGSDLILDRSKIRFFMTIFGHRRRLLTERLCCVR